MTPCGCGTWTLAYKPSWSFQRERHKWWGSRRSCCRPGSGQWSWRRRRRGSAGTPQTQPRDGWRGGAARRLRRPPPPPAPSAPSRRREGSRGADYNRGEGKKAETLITTNRNSVLVHALTEGISCTFPQNQVHPKHALGADLHLAVTPLKEL